MKVVSYDSSKIVILVEERMTRYFNGSWIFMHESEAA